MGKKVIKKEIKKLNAKSHIIKCTNCGTSTKCSSSAEKVICTKCVANMSAIIVKGRKTKLKTKSKRK